MPASPPHVLTCHHEVSSSSASAEGSHAELAVNDCLVMQCLALPGHLYEQQ